MHEIRLDKIDRLSIYHYNIFGVKLSAKLPFDPLSKLVNARLVGSHLRRRGRWHRVDDGVVRGAQRPSWLGLGLAVLIPVWG